MKAIFLSMALSNLVVAQAALADNCTEASYVWNGTRCVAVGAGVAVGGASGIYAAKKYSNARSIESQFTQRLFQDGGLKSGTNASFVDSSVSSVADGDKITIIYNLSEAENREYHIERMRENASSARVTAASYGTLAATAMQSVSVPDGRGGTTTRMEPDWSARALYASMAASKLVEASDFDKKADDARMGGPVPLYELEKVVDGKTGTAQATNAFTRERIDRGGKILNVDRLPAEKFNLVKGAIARGRGGLVGVVTGVGFAAEEAFVGTVAEKYDRSAGSNQQMQRYGYRATAR